LRRRFAPLLIAALMLAHAMPGAAQQTRTPSSTAATALIVGQVVDAATGKGINSALVSLPGGRRLLTTSDGRFVVRNLRPGQYQLTAAKAGYIEGSSGRRRPQGPSPWITLAEGERRTDVVIRLWRHASISGTIMDEAGEPLVNIHVIALRRVIVAGHPRFETGGSGSTDDRGAVPLSTVQHIENELTDSTADASRKLGRLQTSLMEIGLASVNGITSTARMIGDLVQMIPPTTPTPPAFDGTRLYAYPTVFYPSAVTVEAATSFAVGSGQERTAIDFQLTPVPTATVSGTVIGSADKVGNLPVRLLRRGSLESVRGTGSPATVTDAAGRFTFIGVPAGDYTLRLVVMPPPTATTIASGPTRAGSGVVTSTLIDLDATTTASSEQTLWAIAPISVSDTDLTNVNVALRTGVRVSGQLEFDGTTERPAATTLPNIRLSLDAADGQTPDRLGRAFGRLDERNRFLLGGVPGKYFLRIEGLPKGWSLKSAMAGDLDASVTPLELESTDVTNVVVTLTDRPSSLHGTIQVGSAARPDTAAVVVFPTDPKAWIDTGANPRRLRRLLVTQTGTDHVSDLPPGEYYVVALAEEAIDHFPDPDLLEKLAAFASRVHVGDGEKAVQHVRLQEIR
jgi:hypothetical protein